MTKRFVLPDTLPTPYFTVDAGADAALTVRIAPCENRGEARMSVEVWRDDTILCRVFAKSAEVAEALQPASAAESGEKKQNPAGSSAARKLPSIAASRERNCIPTRPKLSADFDPKAMQALAEQMIKDGTMPSEQALEASLERLRKEYGPKILAAREKDRQEASSETPPPPGQQTTSGGTSSEQQTTGKPTHKAGPTYR